MNSLDSVEFLKVKNTKNVFKRNKMFTTVNCFEFVGLYGVNKINQ